MSRFCLPRDIYHGKGCLEELKNLKGKKAILVVGGGSMKRMIRISMVWQKLMKSLIIIPADDAIRAHYLVTMRK